MQAAALRRMQEIVERVLLVLIGLGSLRADYLMNPSFVSVRWSFLRVPQPTIKKSLTLFARLSALFYSLLSRIIATPVIPLIVYPVAFLTVKQNHQPFNVYRYITTFQLAFQHKPLFKRPCWSSPNWQRFLFQKLYNGRKYTYEKSEETGQKPRSPEKEGKIILQLHLKVIVPWPATQ